MFKLADNGYTDIIIYILIMVVGLIANVYKNYSKRKGIEKRSNIPSPEQEPIFPEVLFEPVFDYNEPESEQEIFHEEDADVLDLPQSEIDKVVEEVVPVNTYTEGEAAFENTRNVMISDKVNISGIIEDEDLTTINFFEKEKEVKKSEFEFDVAQAVIYSEILKPKYF